MLALGAAPGLASAQGIDETCVLAVTKFDPALINIAFPDDSADYWVGVYQAVPGTRIRLSGRFPHTRYMSFNVYDQAQRPLDALADIEIEPHPGHVNPFRLGADRMAANRSYTAFIEFGPLPPPGQRKPNTLYTGTGQGGAPNFNGTFIYRTYIPDASRRLEDGRPDSTGGVGIPTATIEPESASAAPAPSPCTNVTKPTVAGINEAIAEQEGFGSSGSVPPLFDRNPPRWRKFTNIFQGVADSLTDSHIGEQTGVFALQRSLNLAERGGSGGFLSNIHNAYLSAGLNKSIGPVVVTRFRAPTFPDTRPDAPTMPDGDLRYWSVCSNDPATQRFIQCINDDRADIGPDGYVTFVVSTPANKPSCAQNWLRWGPNARNVLIYRHMLPRLEPRFDQAIQFATWLDERTTMGEYFPVSFYTTKADYELRGCTPVSLRSRPRTRRNRRSAGLGRRLSSRRSAAASARRR